MLFITVNSFKLEYNISLNNSFVFTLKQFTTIHHKKQLATEIGHIKFHTFVDRCQHFKSLHLIYIYTCGRSAPHCVCLAVSNRWQSGVSTTNFNKTSPTQWSNFYSHHSYINNLYDIELGHKSCDQCLIRNIKHWGTGWKVLLPDCCIAYTKIKPLKCKVVNLSTSSLN